MRAATVTPIPMPDTPQARRTQDAREAVPVLRLWRDMAHVASLEICPQERVRDTSFGGLAEALDRVLEYLRNERLERVAILERFPTAAEMEEAPGTAYVRYYALVEASEELGRL